METLFGRCLYLPDIKASNMQPRQGALAALACMVLSQVVIWRTFDLQAYLVWAVLCVPALLFLFSARSGRDG